jgi:hypothetical protein
VIRRTSLKKGFHLQIWQERGHSSLARGKYWAFSLELGASSFPAACGLSWWKICITRVVLPLAGRSLHQIIPADHRLVAVCGLAGRLTSSTSGCVWTKGPRGGTREDYCWSTSFGWLYLALPRGLSLNLGCHINQSNNRTLNT